MMNNDQENNTSTTVSQLADMVEHRVELANKKLLNAFTGKLINLAIVACLIPFSIKLANELTKWEIVGTITLFGFGYLAKEIYEQNKDDF